MSIIARTAAGAPVASTATGGPSGPAQRRAKATTASGSVHTSVSAPSSAAQRQAALLQIDHQHVGAALARHQADALADRARASTTTCSPAWIAARLTARTAIDSGSAIAATAGVLGLGSGTPGPGRCGQLLLQAAVDVDPDQLKLSHVFGRPTWHG